jgi:hypothetical protein
VSLKHLRTRARRARERGVALIWALFSSILIAGIIFTGTDSFLAVGKMGQAEFSADGQARAVAEAGLVDALAWFRRQTTQPVSTFAPARNLALNPPVNETDNVSLGLVRDYEIMPSLWGRYEVRKPVAAETWTDSNANGLYDYGVRRSSTRTRTGAATPRATSATFLPTAASRARGRCGCRAADHLPPPGHGPGARRRAQHAHRERGRGERDPPHGDRALRRRRLREDGLRRRPRLADARGGGHEGGLITKSSTGTATTAAEPTGSPAKGTITTYDDHRADGLRREPRRAEGDGRRSYVLPSSLLSRIGDYTLNIVGARSRSARASPCAAGVVIVDGT